MNYTTREHKLMAQLGEGFISPERAQRMANRSMAMPADVFGHRLASSHSRRMHNGVNRKKRERTYG